MQDNFYKRMLTIMFATLAVLLLLATTLHAAEKADKTEKATTVQVSITDIREIVTYNSAIETENKQLKASLESERASIDTILKDFSDERKATEQYTQTIEKINSEQKAQIEKSDKRNRRKNYIIAILSAAVVSLAVTH